MTGVNFKALDCLSYILQDVFEKPHLVVGCDAEVFWVRPSLKVIDDEPCGQSFEEVMDLLKQPIHQKG